LPGQGVVLFDDARSRAGAAGADFLVIITLRRSGQPYLLPQAPPANRAGLGDPARPGSGR
jgi:hypothetical protein